MEKNDYTPFGEEWKAEMMKLPKNHLIEKLKIAWEAGSTEDSISRLGRLQASLSPDYGPGPISTVAMLGLVGEAGEVLAETFTLSDNYKFNTQVNSAISECKLIDNYKKQIRKGTVKIYLQVPEENMDNFKSELADTAYYLNILATNVGLTLFDLAQMAHDKIKAKQAQGGSSEETKK